MKAFYFAADNKKLRYGDEREIKVGQTHTIDCEPILCKAGLHASKRLIDALKYAPGHHLYVVELGGKIVHGDDKAVATERSYIAGFDAEKVLREFARKQALINIAKIRDYCSEEDYIFIVRWLKHGNPDDQGLAYSAAESAWSAAAESATESAARSAAESAAWSARSAAREATWSAAKGAARSASESVAREAAWLAAESVAESVADSAWSAAWSAVWSAAESAADKMLTEMVKT